jgi:hypothetical protein
MAQRVLDVADTQAAGITQAAWDQANAVRAAAERDAAAIRQQATSQAAALIEAAQTEAAQTRAAAQQMADELARVAAYVTHTLTLPPDTWTAPPAPITRAAAMGTGATAPPPAIRPRPAGPRPARPDRPDGRPAVKPAGRQAKAARKMTAALAVLALAGVVSGGAEVALHGLPFFVFRANGAGASVTGPDEDQGPGQPNAPGAHRKAAAPTKTPAPRPTPAHKR